MFIRPGVCPNECRVFRAGTLWSGEGGSAANHSRPGRDASVHAVGTQATVKSLAQGDLEALGAQIVLANTYHWPCVRALRLVRDLGGCTLHAWPRAILTDSGGYQVFSHTGRRKIDDDGVTFHSHVDGSPQRLTPESAMAIQADLGSDIAWLLTSAGLGCIPRGALPGDGTHHALGASLRGHDACAGATALRHRARGTDLGLRTEHLAAIAEMSFDGLRWVAQRGEPPETMHAVVREMGPRMPDARPRYLMGVGTPADLSGRHRVGHRHVRLRDAHARRTQRPLVRARGHINIANAVHCTDRFPSKRLCLRVLPALQPRYLAHLFRVKEILYYRLQPCTTFSTT